MTKFQRCILVCFVELLVLLVFLIGVIEFGLGRRTGVETLAVVTLIASLILVIIFASLSTTPHNKGGTRI